MLTPHAWSSVLPAGALVAVGALAIAACSGKGGTHAGSRSAGSGGAGTTGGSGGAAGTGNDGGAAGRGGSSGGSSGGTAGGGGAGENGGATESGGTAGNASTSGGAAGEAGASGGTPASGGTGGTAGSDGGTAGAGGALTPGDCTWVIDGTPSTAIPTVGIIDWSIDLPELTEARVEFTLNDAGADVLNRGSGGPISIEGTTHRALLLGMKPEKTYTYRIVATAGSTVCTSPARTLTTGPKPADAPAVVRTATDAAAQARGFIITTAFTSGATAMTLVLDADGDVVWWATPPAGTGRALMSWEGTDMWMLAENLQNSGGGMGRVSMDGLDVETSVEGLSTWHHDFTVLPGGIVAGPAWVNVGGSALEYKPSDVIERSPDGSLRTVLRLDASTHSSLGDMYQANSIGYHAADDTYTAGDTFNFVFLKFNRDGELLWELGRDCTKAFAPKCAEGEELWIRTWGHQLLPNGNLLFFTHDDFTTIDPAAFEYALTETPTSLTASRVWDYTPLDVVDPYQGDVQRLPNGNTLIAYFSAGLIREVAPDRTIVQALSASYVRHVNFRETLYGPPLR